MANRARTENKKWVAGALAEIKRNQHNISYHLLRTLEQMKVIEPVYVKVEGRGRPIKNHRVTAKGDKEMQKFGGLTA